MGDALDVAGAPLIVALSGGADSAVLAWAVREVGREARAVHVHHGWPGSDRMEAAATAVADRLGVDLERVRVEMSGHGSPEAEARHARYAALGRLVRPGERIATGHTLTDQAETVLGNLMWGSGLDGLRGIHRRRENLTRPLLEVTRDETRELAGLLGLPFQDDHANHDAAFRRVRIRRALTAWERALAPGIGVRLAEMARLVEIDLSLLDEMSGLVEIEESHGTVRIAAAVLRTLPPALAGRVVRRALRAVGGGYPGTSRDVQTVLQVARGGSPTRIAGGRPVGRTGAHIWIGADTGSRPGGSLLRWNVEGTVRWGSWTWEAREYPGRPDAFPFSAWRQVFDNGVFLEREATIRAAEPDDRIAIRTGRKRAADAMAEAGISPGDRRSWPVLEVDGSVIWIPGVRRAYGGWVTDDTIGYILVEVTRERTWKPVGY